MMQPSSHHRRGTRSGFTIVEMVVAMGVTVALSAVCMLAFIGLQRGFAFCTAWSDARTNQVRAFDSLAMDFRNCKSITLNPVSTGAMTTLTMTVPKRYSTYERTGFMAGDPARTATRISPVVNTVNGKVQYPNSNEMITVVYAWRTSGSSKILTRAVTWSDSGTSRTATRDVATFGTDVTISFANRSGGVLAATDTAVVTTVTANNYTLKSTGKVTMSDTVILRARQIR